SQTFCAHHALHSFPTRRSSDLRPERWALRVARPLLLLETLAIPLRRLAQVVNTAILKAAEPTAFSPQPVLTDADYQELLELAFQDRKSTRLNSSHVSISYAVFC